MTPRARMVHDFAWAAAFVEAIASSARAVASPLGFHNPDGYELDSARAFADRTAKLAAEEFEGGRAGRLEQYVEPRGVNVPAPPRLEDASGPPDELDPAPEHCKQCAGYIPPPGSTLPFADAVALRDNPGLCLVCIRTDNG